ncbi:GDP-L-fucose synthase [Robiginitalea sp. SC105]|uniref:GDP-L-fucose synthase family protein n=1 Tax=Robiginitalea sp. SC105 TaxID=2762332 RepID=UPI00163A9FD7|nr:GDP-L-fucose synthase [Robiginitalea sp. SC105]
MEKDTKIYVAGHRGMVGSAVWRALEASGYTHLIGRSSSELDLRDTQATHDFIAKEKPHAIVDAAARVGGILANSRNQYEFLLENLQIQNNLIQGAHQNDVDNFIFLGSSCIYPKMAPQPLKEEYLLTGPLEPTNEGYALAKITGVRLCQALRDQYNRNYVSLMPTNLYGPNDNFDLETSHVLPAMIRKFHEAKQNGNAPVTLWGSGTPRREFLHVDDLARAVVHALEHPLPDNLYNVGTGTDITIKELAGIIQKAVGHTGEIRWDTSKPDGTPRKLMDVSKMKALGWKAEIGLDEGIQQTHEWFLQSFLS